MRKYILIMAATVILFAAGFCMAQMDDISGSVGEFPNGSTIDLLNSHFSQSLPSQETMNQYGRTYYINSKNSLLGDANVVVYIELEFPDKKSYNAELEKYAKLLSMPVMQDDTAFYLLQFSHQAFEQYTDKRIFDGMFFNFEVISTNENQLKITFLNAHVWDSYRDEVLVDFLRLIPD